MRNRITQEIEELHTFFENWLGGTLPKEEEVFGRVTSVLDQNFTLVTPEGEEIQREALVAMLRQGHGGRPQFRIWIENLDLLDHQSPIILARYEECQEIQGKTTRRISTAVFKEDANATNGLVWLRVHETWARANNK